MDEEIEMKKGYVLALTLWALNGCVTTKSSVTQTTYANLPLIQAITDNGDLSKVQKAVEAGADVNEQTDSLKGGLSALQLAKINIYKKENHPGEKYAVLIYLIQKGADVNHSDSYGRTVFGDLITDSLHQEDNFTEAQKIAMVNLMYKKGLQVNKPEPKTGDTPLHFVVMNAIKLNKYSKLIDLLLDRGANPDQKNFKGESPSDIIEKLSLVQIKVPYIQKLKKMKLKSSK